MLIVVWEEVRKVEMYRFLLPRLRRCCRSCLRLPLIRCLGLMRVVTSSLRVYGKPELLQLQL